MARVNVENVSVDYRIFGVPAGAGDSASGSRGAGIFERRNGAVVVHALKEVSFEATPGMRLAIIGRNGSGKTTLLRVLAGVYEPAQGRCRIEGSMESLLNLWLGIRPDATGWRNLELRGLMRGLDFIEARKLAREIAEVTELGAHLDFPVSTYSAGMMMRLSFAMATAHQPDILLLDEWIGAGDAAFQKKVKQRMQEMIDASGVVVLCSHNNALLRYICSHALWLDSGRVIQFGEASAVIDAYEAFTATGELPDKVA